MGVIPAVRMLEAFLALKLFEVRKALGAATAALLLFSNLFAFPVALIFKPTVWWPLVNQGTLRFPILDYLEELTDEFRGPVRGMVEYLRLEAGRASAFPYPSGIFRSSIICRGLRSSGVFALKIWPGRKRKKRIGSFCGITS